MDKKLFAADATIQTATVEVKVLTIGKRQMTLAVFRQLPEEEIFDADQKGFPLRGVPWGRVNYCPDKKCQEFVSAHIHIVWQKGNELRRCTLTHSASEMWLLDHMTKQDVVAWNNLYQRIAALDQLFIAV